MPTYADFTETHPEYKAELWNRYRALYSGGARLLEDEKILKQLLPRHHDEEDEIYKERCKRAFYIPVAGEIIDSIVAALSGEPISVHGVVNEATEVDSAGKVSKKVVENPDPFYDDFYGNVSRVGARPMTLQDLLNKCMLSALQTKHAWICVDLPAPDDDPPDTEIAQRAAGKLDAYAYEVLPEDVLNWETDDNNELTCALVRQKKAIWAGPGHSRDKITELFTFYTRDAWERWSITYSVDDPPDPEDPMVFVDKGGHSFGSVPLIHLELTDGLHAMGKLASLAGEHFNKRCATSWSQLKNLLPLMYAKITGTQIDPSGDEAVERLLNQRVGPGRIMIIGGDDEIGHAAPDPLVYDSVLADLKSLEETMRTVLRQMSISAEAQGAALRRSAESKQADQGSLATLLRELGHYLRDMAIALYRMLSVGRADKTQCVWHARGADDFSDTSTASIIDQAVALEQVQIPSATFQRRKALMVAKVMLGSDCSPEDIENIEKELESTITDEQFIKPTPMQQFAVDSAAAKAPPGQPKTKGESA